MVMELCTTCCGQAMRALGVVDVLGSNIEKVQRWLCPECGRGIDLVEYFLEAEALENELDLYAQAEPPEALHLHVFTGGLADAKPDFELLQSQGPRQVNATRPNRCLPEKEKLKGGVIEHD